MPRVLKPENKQAAHLTTYLENLSPYNADPAKFLRRYVITDETWAYHFDPETKLQSKVWKHTTSPPPVKFRKIASAGKVMASVFWDSEGVLMIYYLESAPCGLQGCKNGPAPFPGWMSYKATNPGLVSVLYLSMFFIVLVFIRAPFYVLLVFIVCFLSFGCSS